MTKLSVMLPDGRILWFQDRTRDGNHIPKCLHLHPEPGFIGGYVSVLIRGKVAVRANHRTWLYNGQQHAEGNLEEDLMPCEPPHDRLTPKDG